MYADLQLEHETITERYDHLHQKSQDIIQKLQLERDNRILECENLKKQVGAQKQGWRIDGQSCFLLDLHGLETGEVKATAGWRDRGTV